MKKIMSDRSFWIILVISVLSLIMLTVGVIFLTRKNTKEFYSAGYIISSSATKTDKFYFGEKTVYKENVFQEYVFKDVDNNEVSTSKQNFIHYLDNSLSFMKNGVILDLDNFNENIVPYYNITDKSIIKYSNGGYYIETADKTLVFGNFLGRITDNKYIVVGNDISVKMAGNNESVKGNYFEILFVEDGIVKIENQEGSYQTISDGSYVYIGENIKINLGDKSVNYGDEAKLSLSELTIDGNENIDIVPEGEVNKDDETNDGGNSQGNNQEDGNKPNDTNNPDTGDGTNAEGETTSVLKKEVAVNLIEASSNVNSITAKFQVIDTMDAIKGNLVLTLVNTDTGKTVYTKVLANVVDEQYVYISSLPSDCNYVMTIVDENNETQTQYFQKSFRTDSLNLRLKRELVTETSLTYSLDFGVQSDAVQADVSLFDESGNKLGSYTIENGSDKKVTFEGLTNNTLYDVVVDKVVIKNVQYDDLYSTRTSDMTLKNKPVLGEISVETNDETKNFTLKMDSVIDEDEAIVKYTYEIYKAEDITEETVTTAVPVYSFSRNELDDQILSLDAEKNLYNNSDYRFKIVAQYYDNYRYNEIETRYSDYFEIVGKPTLTFEASEIDINRIAGSVIIKDEGCTIPFEGRQCSETSNMPNDFIIRYYGGSSSTRNTVENVVVDPENLTLSFDLNGLQENTLYTFEVYADIDLRGDYGFQEGQYIGGFNVSTTGIKALMMQNWKDNEYSYENPISFSTEMISTSPEDDSIDKLASVKFNLYAGDVRSYIGISEPVASFTITDDIKGKLYNKSYAVTTNMFEYINNETSDTLKINDLSVLKEISGGKLSRYYTIEVTDAFDETQTNEFAIMNNLYVYEIPAILLLEDQVAEPEILVEEITNKQTNNDVYKDYGIDHISQLDDNIVRGYKVTAIFDKTKIESYFATSNPITKINFYAHGSNGGLVEKKIVDFVSEEEYTVYFFLERGTEYGTFDSKLTRGNPYTFSYDLSIDDDGDPVSEELVFPADKPTSELFTPVKQPPMFKMYIDNSTDTTITYKYQVRDYDNAIYKENGKYYIHYTVSGNEEEYTTEFNKNDMNSGIVDSFTLSNLSNGSVYNIGYYSAVVKDRKPAKNNIGSYFFDGYYNASDYALNYNLEYSNFDNRVKIIIEDNELLDRVSSYLLTLNANGEKYQRVISELNNCDDRKCIIVDYKDISSFKGKNVTVSIDALYDNGYIGFGQNSVLNEYFKSLGYDNASIKSNLGFVYQNIYNNGNKGKYFYVTNNKKDKNNVTTSYSGLLDYPRGILGFELNTTNNMNEYWKLNAVNLLDINNMNFVSEVIKSSDIDLMVSGNVGGTITIPGTALNIVPKVLDKISLNSTNNTFKFTSITPKVDAVPNGQINNNRLINGAIMSINVSSDTTSLETDFVPTDGKYKFYVDIYQKRYCSETDGEQCEDELVFVKTVETDYDNLSEVVIDGLKPATLYYYKIAADMNKNGEKVKTPLFDLNKAGYEEFLGSFNTLNAEEIFEKVTYKHDSITTEEVYSYRELMVDAYLKNTINFDVKFELFDDIGNSEFGSVTINNSEINVDKKMASYVQDVSGNDFVFGPNYHELVITAVTTEGNDLELYRGKLIFDEHKEQVFGKLENPTFTLRQDAGISGENGNYNYNITSKIGITDEDRVINDGKVYVELQDATYTNACPGNENDCRAEIYIKDNKCTFESDGKVNSCVVNGTGDGRSVDITFDGLRPDTNYSMYVYTNTYRNNVDLNDNNKDSLVYVRKNQYTRSALDFSLGAVTPTVISKHELRITFVGSSNLTDRLVGIGYTITEEGAGQVTSGSLGGNIDNPNTKLSFVSDADGYPTLTIKSDKELGLNNYIIIKYYYKDRDGSVKLLDIGGNTSYQYTVKNEK